MRKRTESICRFPILAARDIIASLKLIDGDGCFWGDQRKIELRTSGSRNGVLAGLPVDHRQPRPKNLRGGFKKCEPFLARHFSPWQSPPPPLLALTTRLVLGN